MADAELGNGVASDRASREPWAHSALKALLLGGAGVLLVVWLAHGMGGGGALWSVVARAAPEWLVVAFGVLALSVVLAVVRWRMVLLAMGHVLAFRTALEAVLAAMPLSAISPSRVNDLLRAHAVRQLIPPLATVGSVLAERAIDVQVLFLLALLGALSMGHWTLALVAFSAALLEWAVLLAFVRAGHRAIQRFERHKLKLEQLLSAFEALAHAPGKLFSVGLASAGVWLANIAMIYTLTRAFSAGVSLLDALALWPPALFVGLLPVTLGGLGTRDAAFAYLLQGFGAGSVDRAAVLAATLSYAVYSTWVPAVVGLPFMGAQWFGSRRRSLVENGDAIERERVMAVDGATGGKSPRRRLVRQDEPLGRK